MPATLTRQFKSGNSLAVRIPAGMAFAPDNVELLIERVGSELRIRPKGEKLTDLVDLFAALGEGAKEPWVREDLGPEALRAWDKPED